jgi:hypothetical protein
VAPRFFAGLAAVALLQLPRSADADVEGEQPAERPGPHAYDRFELRPIVGWGSSVGTSSHWFVGGGAYFHVPYVTLGIDAVAFELFNDDAVAPSTYASYPANETSWAATMSIAVSPFRSHVHADGTERALLPYVMGGLGGISTRPLSLVDPSVRSFDFKAKVTFDAAIGVYVLLSRAVGLDIELRDMIFGEQLESSTISQGVSGSSSYPTNPDTWYASSTRMTNFVALQIGVSFFAGGR